MSKSVKVAALVAGLAAAGYVGGTWYMGKTVESAINNWYDQMGQVAYVEVISRDYNRSLFGATDDAVMQVSKAYLKTLFEGSPDMMQAVDEIDPSILELHIHSDIKHGPLPGAAPAAGRVLTTVNFSPEMRATLDKFLGGKPPLQADTSIGFAGGGKTEVSSPPVKVIEGGLTLDWAGLNATTDFSNGFERYSLDASMPKFVMLADGMTVEVNNIKAKANQKRIFPDSQLLNAGTMNATVDSIKFVPPPSPGEQPFTSLVLDDVAYDTEIPVNGDFLDIIAKMRTNSIQVDDANYGPAHFDMSFLHLHARSTATFYDEYMKLYTNPAMVEAMQSDPMAALASLSQPVGELLKHDPQIRFDRISFNTPAGETRMSLAVTPKGMTLEDFQNPMALVGKVTVDSELTVPMQFIASMMASSESGLDADSAFAMVDMQAKPLIDAGYVVRNGDVLNTRLRFANGQLTANDKQVDPALLGM